MLKWSLISLSMKLRLGVIGSLFETNLCSGHPYAPNLTKRTKQISHSVDIYLVDFALEKTRLVVKDNSCAQ